MGDENAHRRALTGVLRRAGMSVEQLWLSYLSLGGQADPFEIEAYLQGALPMPPLERDVLAVAANELLEELAGTMRVPLSRILRDPLPDSGPLAALVRVLQDTPRALSGRLAATADSAALDLGVEVDVYLADYEQAHLVRVPRDPGKPGQPLERLAIDSTLAGRAYQTAVMQPSVSDPRPRLWVPLLDGVERLGVLGVTPPTARDLADPLLRDQCGWLASLLAHLAASAAHHGDALERVRRTRPRTAAAELMWSLLPPLMTGSERFTLAGLREPAYEVAGDVFDYALDENRVDLAVFDGMGHALGASLITAAAIAAYRAARRAGDSLYAQALAVDDALSSHFPEAFATGVLAELDLTKGRLRYLAAGHPAPLLLRSGKVVGALQDGRRVPFGLETGEVTVGEAFLQPGDWLTIYTDGITEARDSAGAQFGADRLVDFLERAAATGYPPAETLRRLGHAVLRHQDGVLQDDATVLLAQWAPPPLTPPGRGAGVVLDGLP